jgi:predicted phage terminase large subunit-like protein
VKTRYYPALITLDDGSEASLWPERWSLEWLQQERHKRSFALNYLNMPMSAEDGLWSPADFMHPAPPNITRRIISVDPATTSKTTSDYTGIAVIGFDPVEERCAVERVEQKKISPAQLKSYLLRLIQADESIKMVVIETNQGGDTWAEILSELPVKVLGFNSTEPKLVRAYRALDWYQNGWVSHPNMLSQFETQALAFPNVTNDDMVDAVCAGLKVFLGKKKRSTPQATTSEYA